MIFDLIRLNIITMKKIAFLLSVVFVLSACTTSKELTGSKAENRKFKKLAEQALVKKAVESRKYVIKVNRLYTIGGGTFELVPRSNFVIINGEIASISLGYMGRSYSSRPISGINLNGHTLDYKMQSDETKGLYKVQMAVKAGADKFDVYITIGNEGYCTVSLNNSYIQSVSYYGTLVPLPENRKVQQQEDRI
jgi:hypothetical protein